MIKLNKFQKHIMLYCKGQYNIPNEEKGFLIGLKRIWAVRCGIYDIGEDSLPFIADDILDIIHKCSPEREVVKDIHRSLFYPSKDLSPMESLIYKYKEIILSIEVRKINSKTNKMEWIIDLQGIQPELFNRIIEGNGKYKDYEKVK